MEENDGETAYCPVEADCTTPPLQPDRTIGRFMGQWRASRDASRRSKEELRLLLFVRRVIREQQPAQDDKPDRDAGDGQPGSDFIHLSLNSLSGRCHTSRECVGSSPFAVARDAYLVSRKQRRNHPLSRASRFTNARFMSHADRTVARRRWPCRAASLFHSRPSSRVAPTLRRRLVRSSSPSPRAHT